MAQLQAVVNKGAWLLNHRYFTVEVFLCSDLHEPEANDFQNLISSFLSKDTSLVKFT